MSWGVGAEKEFNMTNPCVNTGEEGQSSGRESQKYRGARNRQGTTVLIQEQQSGNGRMMMGIGPSVWNLQTT